MNDMPLVPVFKAGRRFEAVTWARLNRSGIALAECTAALRNAAADFEQPGDLRRRRVFAADLDTIHLKGTCFAESGNTSPMRHCRCSLTSPGTFVICGYRTF